jgi:hypothetical protein
MLNIALLVSYNASDIVYLSNYQYNHATLLNYIHIYRIPTLLDPHCANTLQTFSRVDVQKLPVPYSNHKFLKLLDIRLCHHSEI